MIDVIGISPASSTGFFSLGLVVAVIGQGLMGGLRVVEVSRYLAMIHGIVGQMFFALMVAYRSSVAVSPMYRVKVR